MNNLRTYGSAPFTVVVLHGGPGAPGSMAPVARALADEWGVLEPLQTTPSIDGQVEELRAIFQQHGALPMTLIGASWGAMLGLIFAAREPALVRKLLLVGSGVYDERYAAEIDRTRQSRITAEERLQLAALESALDDPTIPDKDALMAQVGRLSARTDAYEPIPHESQETEVSYECFTHVWSEAQALRSRGGFLELAQRIQCPVVAIHGDFDPHPAAGVREPLAGVLHDFRFILLERCGHEPWIERHARDQFFAILRAELPG